MSCTITLTGYQSSLNSTGILLTLNGTAENCNCDILYFEIDCGGHVIKNIPVQITWVTPVIYGTWSLTIQTECLCADRIQIKANCNDDVHSFPIITSPCCCPTLTLTKPIFRPCDANGNHPVSFSYDITPSTYAPCPDIIGTLAILTSGSSQVWSTPVSSPNNLSGPVSLPLPPGTYTVTLTLTSPRGCPPMSVSFTVPPCDCCPTLEITTTIGECDKDCKRPVTITYTVTPSSNPNCPPLDATLNIPGIPPITINSSNLSGTVSGHYTPGSYNATLVIISPPNCPPQTKPFNVPNCCPQTEITTEVKKDCNADQTKDVTINAFIVPHPNCPPITAVMTIDGNQVVAQGSGSNPFTLTYSGKYKCLKHSVVISYPGTDCPDDAGEFCVPVCETKKCNIRRKHFEISATVAIILWLLFLFNSCYTFLFVSASIATICSIVLYFIWHKCRKICKPCPWKLAVWEIALASFLGFLMLGKSSLIAIYNWLYAILFSSVGPFWAIWIAIIIIILILLIIAFLILLAFLSWVAKCCPTNCEKWKNIFYSVVYICGASFAIISAIIINVLGWYWYGSLFLIWQQAAIWFFIVLFLYDQMISACGV